MKSFPRVRALVALCLCVAPVSSSDAYNVLGPRWPVGASIVLKLGLGTPGTPLQDGFVSWNASAADAAGIWSGYLDLISLSSVSSATVPQVADDGVSAVFFASTVFGDSFGQGTLAVTVTQTDPTRGIDTTEADVVVNSAVSFNSYAGVQQPGVFDLHRVLLHEFGHVLGLAHNPETPLGTKIMEPVVSDWDHLGADDIAGVRFLYGVDFVNLPPPTTLRVGDSFTYTPELNLRPSSYSATGLPPGLTINANTGVVSGKVTKLGLYGPVLTAKEPAGASAYGSFSVNVSGAGDVTGVEAILRLGAATFAADPIRARIYTGGESGINMIDADTFQVTNLVSTAGGTVTISADGSKLLFVRPQEALKNEHRIDLETLQVLPDLKIPAHSSSVQEGVNNHAYVADGSGAIYEFDATTGAVQFIVPPGVFSSLTLLSLSPDRTTLYASEFDGIAVYDISGDRPLLKTRLQGNAPVTSAAGDYLYYTIAGDALQSVPLPALTPVKSLFSDSSMFFIMAAAPDGSVYAARSTGYDTIYSLVSYQPETSQLTTLVSSDDLASTESLGPFFAGAFDQSGRHFFFSVGSSEVWVQAADAASLPPVTPTKNLLNISTRVKVGSGENAMIGGFIVQGTNPKKVVIRGLGPSLPVTGALSDPVLDLYDAAGHLMASNDNWISNFSAILGTQLAPSSERESALSVTLAPGAYTAVVHDQRNQPGLSLIEVYDLDPKDSLLANISTRGKVESGASAMIGGFIIGGKDATQVLVRAIGPSLAQREIAGPLADPVLELYDSAGKLISSNDNWRSTQQSDISATGLAPTDDRESAILATLAPGNYTAIVNGANNGSGVALVEVYNLDATTQTTK